MSRPTSGPAQLVKKQTPAADPGEMRRGPTQQKQGAQRPRAGQVGDRDASREPAWGEDQAAVGTLRAQHEKAGQLGAQLRRPKQFLSSHRDGTGPSRAAVSTNRTPSTEAGGCGAQCEKSLLFLAFPQDKKSTVKKWVHTIKPSLEDNETRWRTVTRSLQKTRGQKRAGRGRLCQSTHMHSQDSGKGTFQFQIHV